MTKRIIKALGSIRTERRSQVFYDFVEVSAIAIANSVDRAQFDGREERYMAVINKYDKAERMALKDSFHLFVDILSKGCGDHLGGIFMELDLGDSLMGQFFSPYDLCQLNARMILDRAQVEAQISAKGFITVNEPTVGGGGLVIAIAELLSEWGFNPQQQMHVVCQDIDITAVHMSYLQLALLGIPAAVYHGDTLRMKFNSGWYTPMHVMGGWGRKLGAADVSKTATTEGAAKAEELVAKTEKQPIKTKEQQPKAKELVVAGDQGILF